MRTIDRAESTATPERSQRGRRIMALILAVLVLLLGLLTYLLYDLLVVPGTGNKTVDGKESTEELEWVSSIYGKSNQTRDLFSQTVSAVPGPDGSIWVTEVNTRLPMHFTADGRYLETVGSTDSSIAAQPASRMTVGPDGLLYVCQTAVDEVLVMQPDGTVEGSFTVPQPVSIAVSEDRIAVGSVYGFAILDKTGTPIKVVGGRGKGEGQFDYVHGVAFDDAGNVYVADSYNNRLSAYDRDGNRLWIQTTGSPANTASFSGGMLTPSEATTATTLVGSDQLQLPLGITVDGAGRIVVSDMYDCTLAVFDAKTGDLIAKYGDAGADDGQFFYPVGVAYDKTHDWFTVADGFNKRVQIVRIPGSSSGPSVIASVKRGLAGPIRACLFPLLLILLAIITYSVVRYLRRRQEEGSQGGVAAARSFSAKGSEASAFTGDSE
jgi:sugar lactone lactonase YvrE